MMHHHQNRNQIRNPQRAELYQRRKASVNQNQMMKKEKKTGSPQGVDEQTSIVGARYAAVRRQKRHGPCGYTVLGSLEERNLFERAWESLYRRESRACLGPVAVS